MRIASGVGMLVLAAALGPTDVRAQGGTDIWVAPFTEAGSSLRVARARNVTNRLGYDNQPSFTAAGDAILFTSIREDAQADIWRVALGDGATKRMTETATSEYSATTTPDGLSYSVIRVELPDSAQRLWKFPFDGGAPSLVLKALRPVGYHVWVSDHLLGTFVLGSPNALVMVDARTERADTLTRNIGRALVRVPGRDAFTFVQMGATRTDTSWISEVDTRTRAIRRVAPSPVRDGYHVWTKGGRLITATESRLLLWVDGRWDVLADFSDLGVTGITRLALSPTGDRIAFVAEDRGTP
jgi:hypothetical protein